VHSLLLGKAYAMSILEMVTNNGRWRGSIKGAILYSGNQEGEVRNIFLLKKERDWEVLTNEKESGESLK